MDPFCIDTSAFIESWHRLYPIDVFSSFWDKVDSWAADGRVISPEEVLKEIEIIDDDLYKWVKMRNHIFRPPDAGVQTALGDILKWDPKLAVLKRGGTGADPWVVAQAIVSKATVVTLELQKGGGRQIPRVCEHWGVKCTNVVGLMREMNLKF